MNHSTKEREHGDEQGPGSSRVAYTFNEDEAACQER